MKNNVKLALAMIVKPTQKEADYLKQCLSFIAPHVDGIFITITTNGDTKPVEEVAKLYGANISFYEVSEYRKFSFADARNYNFSQVTKDYTHILWLDADDGFRGGEKLKPTLEEYPHVDVFSLYYMYAFDKWKNPVVVHTKTQIVKNDGCVSWAGALHEDFRENRKISRFFIKGVERIHLADEESFNDNKERNVEVALGDLENNPNDPRSYWNYGNSLKGAGKNEEAIEAFNKFLEMSDSDDEKYIVRIRRAESYWILNERFKAIEEAQFAIGLKPDYPDAYHLLGNFYHEVGRLEDACKVILQGLVKKPPYTSILVYNPRDYDYTPMMRLAMIYFEMSRPDLSLPLLEGCLKIQPKDEHLKKTIKTIKKEVKRFDKVVKLVKKLENEKDDEVVKKEFDKIPGELRSHPSLCYLRNKRFVKKKSSGKDVVIYCGYTKREWNPDIAKNEGIGGSEESVIHLARIWADLGWNVEVYNNCGHKHLKFGNVTYKPYYEWNYRDKQDVVILWRNAKPLDYEINADKIFLDLHDVIQEGEFTDKRLQRLNKVFVKTEFHRSLFPNVPDKYFSIVPNGIDVEVFKRNDIERDQYLMINTSSPDRSLSALVDLFIEVKKQVPEAKMKACYGWGVFDTVHSSNSKIMKWKKGLIDKIERTEGFEYLDLVSHDEIPKLHLSANVFAYPTEFAEIHCISAVKAQAAGNHIVSTDFAALNETVKFGDKIHSDKTKDNWCPPHKFDFSLMDEDKRKEWVECAVRALKTPVDEEKRNKMREWAFDTYNWSKIANKWLKEF